MKIDFSTPDLPLPETDFDHEVLAFIRTWLEDSPTVPVQTSGSTGKPKIFQIEKDRMRASANMTCDILNLKEGDSALLCLPVAYISGKMMVVRALERKLKLFVQAPSANPLSTWCTSIDFAAMSPMQVEKSVGNLHHIKKLLIGGAAVSENLKIKIAENLHQREGHSLVYETYGMSETLSHIALKEIYPTAEEYFQVLKNIDIALDHRDCLQIRAPQLHPETLHTNDLVEIKDKNHFKFLGRIDHVINSGGLKIYPEQLENILKKEITHDLVFTALPDPHLGEKLILAVEGKDSQALREKISGASYPTKNHRPRDIFFLREFPRIPNGKVNRLELLNLIKDARRQ